MKAMGLKAWVAVGLIAIGLVVVAVCAVFRADRAAQAATQPATAPEPIPIYDARPLTVRDGIGNVAAKLSAGSEVTVAFLGGPITLGGGDRGFPQLVMNWLRVNYPRATVRLVNAGSVDAGSSFGAARYDRDVRPHKPNLLFVEFAVDDAGQENRLHHFERIVRKAWTADPATDVVFLYAVHADERDHYRGGKLPPAASVQERVAEHYGVPSIAMGLDLIPRVDTGKAKWPELFYERSRPTPAGHAAYANAVIAALETLLGDETSKKPLKHELKSPLTEDLIVQATSRPATTMPAPPAMTTDAGQVARETYVMPLIGVHWMGSPEFADADGRVLWRLRTQSASENGRRLNPTFGLDRSRWGPPMRWFGEWRLFTGPAGVYLAGANPKLNNITAREDDLPILTFTAPRAGEYVLRVKGGGVVFWGLHNTLAMNIAHFPAGQTKGKSLAFHRAQARVADNPNIEVKVRLNEGDDLAFLFDTNATGGGGGASYRDLDIVVGWFGE